VEYEKARLPKASPDMIVQLLQEEILAVVGKSGHKRSSIQDGSSGFSVSTNRSSRSGSTSSTDSIKKLEKRLSRSIGRVSFEQLLPGAPVALKVEPPTKEEMKKDDSDEEEDSPFVATLLKDTENAANLILSNDKLLSQADELLNDTTNYYSINDFEDLDIGEEFTQQLLTMLKVDG